jgi:hypothetical protein
MRPLSTTSRKLAAARQPRLLRLLRTWLVTMSSLQALGAAPWR